MKIEFPCKCGHLEKDHFAIKNDYNIRVELYNYCRICKNIERKVCDGYNRITDTNEIIAWIKKHLDKQNG